MATLCGLAFLGGFWWWLLTDPDEYGTDVWLDSPLPPLLMPEILTAPTPTGEDDDSASFNNEWLSDESQTFDGSLESILSFCRDEKYKKKIRVVCGILWLPTRYRTAPSAWSKNR